MARMIGMTGILVAALALPTTSIATTRDEARSAAGALWVKILTKCGGDYYYGASTLDGPPPGARSAYLNPPEATHSRDIREFKGVTFVLAASSLTDADRLNGIEWEGSTRISSTAQRITDRGSWLDWGSDNLFGLSVVMQKRNGQWTYRTQQGDGWSLDAISATRPSCNDALLIR